MVHIDEPDLPGEHRLLIRRNRRTGELAFYRCWTLGAVPIADLVRVAGMRWRIEENIQAGKGLAALDEHQVRAWTSWHRWTVLAMLAHAFLAVAAERTHHTVVHQLIPLTCNEIRHLFVSLLNHARHDAEHHCTGPAGDDNTKPSPAPTTADEKPPAMITIYNCRTRVRPRFSSRRIFYFCSPMTAAGCLLPLPKSTSCLSARILLNLP